MRRRKNPWSIITIFVFTCVIGGIFYMNHWISDQVDETTKSNTLPSKVVQSNLLKKKVPIKVRNTPIKKDEAPVNMTESTLEPSSSVEVKKTKIIYELPLDDVILIQ